MTQIVAITGASGGIGRATARAFGERGDTVVLMARREEGLQGAADDVRAAGGTPVTIGLAGIGWGGVLIVRGTELFRVLQDRSPSQGEQDAIVILGFRHLAQGVVQVVAPHHFGRLYAVVDALHAASMVALAIGTPVRSRAALTSAAVATIAGVASYRFRR